MTRSDPALPLLRRARFCALCVPLLMAGCGLVYHSPQIQSGQAGGASVKVIALTPESVLAANSSPFSPAILPAAFHQTTGPPGPGRAPDLPAPSLSPPRPGATVTLSLPPDPVAGPYLIGTGDVMMLTRKPGADLPGAPSLPREQSLRVQDDGKIALPDLGRLKIAGLTLEQAQAALFARLIERRADPGFSLEISEFNARKVTLGGGVARPGLVPVTLTPLTLDTALASVGGLAPAAREEAVIRLYRDGSHYTLPLRSYLSTPAHQKLRLKDGDAVFVDPGPDPARAEAWFHQEIRLAEARSEHRAVEIRALEEAAELRRAELEEQRLLFERRQALGAEGAGFVYLTGEIPRPGRWPLPFERRASLADALYERGGVLSRTGNSQQIYVLRGSGDPAKGGEITAWQLDGSTAGGLVLATRMELRPNDVIFVAEQPVTRWNRVFDQISPSLISVPLDNATRP